MLKPFLNKYDTVIFDMDGVITSEQAYWDCAALAVYEYISGINGKITDAQYCIRNVKAIRADVFYNDKIIIALKEKGVNSNWDLTYISVCVRLITGLTESADIYEYISALKGNALNIYLFIADALAQKTGLSAEYTKRGGELWNKLQACFQEWYLGDELYKKTYGKNAALKGKIGFIYNEEPFIRLDVLKKLLTELSAQKTLCIGTGRVYQEIALPLKKWDCLKYFDKNRIITYDHVINAEKMLNTNTLTKPNPYMFLKALYGENYNDADLVDGNYDEEKIKTALVVGDAGADMFAAKTMGADFCAVLTGVSGQKAKPYFEKNNADYILDSVEDFIV